MTWSLSSMTNWIFHNLDKFQSTFHFTMYLTICIKVQLMNEWCTLELAMLLNWCSKDYKNRSMKRQYIALQNLSQKDLVAFSVQLFPLPPCLFTPAPNFGFSRSLKNPTVKEEYTILKAATYYGSSLKC